MNYAGDIPSRVSSTFPKRRAGFPHSTDTSCLMIDGKSSSASYQRWAKLWSLFCGRRRERHVFIVTCMLPIATVQCMHRVLPVHPYLLHTQHVYRLGVLIWNDSCCTWGAIYHLKLLIGHGWKTVFIWNLLFSMPVFSIQASQTETECGDCGHITNLWL